MFLEYNTGSAMIQNTILSTCFVLGTKRLFPCLWFFPTCQQGQHHHQRDQLRHQRVRRLCHLLHPGLHGPPPGCGRVRGGRPGPRPGLRGLPRGPHTAACLPALVHPLLLHAHSAGPGNSGRTGQAVGKSSAEVLYVKGPLD